MKGYRHGTRERQILAGTFGTETISVPRARVEGDHDGKIRVKEGVSSYIFSKLPCPVTLTAA